MDEERKSVQEKINPRDILAKKISELDEMYFTDVFLFVDDLEENQDTHSP